MDRYFARIVRALIVSTLGFGGGVALMVLIVTLVFKGDQHAFQYGLNAGLLIGGIFAVLLVCVLLPLDLTTHLFAAKGLYKEIWELEQSREITLEGSAKEIMSRARQGLLSVPYVKSVSDNPERYALKATIGTSWRSYGEDMEVEVEKLAEDKWRLLCTSRSATKNVLFDYAKNFDNVEAWLRAVKNPKK
jgi:hypothetical protein